jgi:hypothetical protein
VKFRRRSADPDPSAEQADQPDQDREVAEDEATGQAAQASSPRKAGTDGPYDISEIDAEAEGRVDLGSLLIAPSEGREVRLQVDEATQAVQSVLIAGRDGALELRAFAAPRNGDLWSDVRPELVADVKNKGGTVEEREGRFGTELVCQRPVQMPDGTSGVQPSRIIGVNGSRWLLRGTFLGAPAVRPDEAEEWEDVLAQVAVRRGDHAMPVGDALALVLPNQARRLP